GGRGAKWGGASAVPPVLSLPAPPVAPRPAPAAWPMYAGGPPRFFSTPAEMLITAANVAGLHVKWTFPTGAPVTGSPAVVTLDLPGEGRHPVAFIASWGNFLNAVRVRGWTALWGFPLVEQRRAALPHAAFSALEHI